MRWLFTSVAKYWYLFSFTVLAVITVFSLIPLPELPEFPGSDKTHHFVAYSALMFPVALRKPQYWLWIACVFIIWSGAIEMIQPFMKRYGEWLDLLANMVGVSIGAIIGLATRALVGFKA